MTILTHRIRLDLNNTQRTWMTRCAGTSRFTWNLGLARWKELYEAGDKPSWQKLDAEVNARKKTDLPWLYELPWKITNAALSDLGSAFKHFFRRVKAGEEPGYPRFKKRGRCRESFSVEGRKLVFDGKQLRIPKLGWVRMREPLRFPGKILSARVTRHAGHWYVSIHVKIDKSRWSYPHHCETQAVVGIDLGVRDLAVLSDSTRIKAPRVLRTHKRKLRQLNKEMSRRTEGGRNWYKTKAKLTHLHERIANVRQDITHKLTAQIIQKFRTIGIEDLCVKGMARTRLAKSVMDAAMAEVRRQLTYKAPLAGSAVVIADRWFPSSKTCSACGVVVGALPLSTRQWTCEACSAVHDRDVNAAINLRNMAAACAATAQCQGSSGVLTGVKLSFGWESSSAADLG